VPVVAGPTAVTGIASAAATAVVAGPAAAAAVTSPAPGHATAARARVVGRHHAARGRSQGTPTPRQIRQARGNRARPRQAGRTPPFRSSLASWDRSGPGNDHQPGKLAAGQRAEYSPHPLRSRQIASRPYHAGWVRRIGKCHSVSPLSHVRLGAGGGGVSAAGRG